MKGPVTFSRSSRDDSKREGPKLCLTIGTYMYMHIKYECEDRS
jgi:hypothetical protein